MRCSRWSAELPEPAGVVMSQMWMDEMSVHLLQLVSYDTVAARPSSLEWTGSAGCRQ
jgi:hypothetical protein